MYLDNMIIYGGKDDENNKLSDIWIFNFGNYIWTEIQLSPLNYVNPLPRSGHSVSLYKDYMIVFGGIYEVTKELDDLIVFDIKKKKWV